jgi:hypothetical protein
MFHGSRTELGFVIKSENYSFQESGSKHKILNGGCKHLNSSRAGGAGMTSLPWWSSREFSGKKSILSFSRQIFHPLPPAWWDVKILQLPKDFSKFFDTGDMSLAFLWSQGWGLELSDWKWIWSWEICFGWLRGRFLKEAKPSADTMRHPASSKS